MEILGIDGKLGQFGFAPPQRKGATSERSYIVKQIHELTGIPFKSLLFKHLGHIPAGNEGLKLLKFLYSEAITEDTVEGKRKRFWWLLKQTKV